MILGAGPVRPSINNAPCGGAFWRLRLSWRRRAGDFSPARLHRARGFVYSFTSLHIHPTPVKTRRHALIRSLISAGGIHSQAELAQRLAHEGVEATQATLSRDLAEIGVLKGPEGYQLPGVAPSLATAPAAGFARVLRRELLSIEVGGTLVVLKTPSGHGNALAIELDRAELDGALGTIAGDDTIFLAARGEAAARRIARQLRELAQLA